MTLIISLFVRTLLYSNNTGIKSMDVLISAAMVLLFAVFSLLNVIDGLSVCPTLFLETQSSTDIISGESEIPQIRILIEIYCRSCCLYQTFRRTKLFAVALNSVAFGRLFGHPVSLSSRSRDCLREFDKTRDIDFGRNCSLCRIKKQLILINFRK